MKASLFLIATLFLSLATHAQTIVTATKTQDDLDLCYMKQLSIQGYAYANLIGRCAWDPAMNGMQLTLVAMPEDPMQSGHKIELDNVRDVVRAQSNGKAIQFSVVQDTMDAEGNITQLGKTITVRSIDPKKGTFRVTPRR
jgi:hypothetical protein